jgi:hypothetical protein
MRTEASDASKQDLVKLGADEEISIHELAHLVSGLMGYAGKSEWDSSRIDGQLRDRLNISHALKESCWQARTPMKDYSGTRLDGSCRNRMLRSEPAGNSNSVRATCMPVRMILFFALREHCR